MTFGIAAPFARCGVGHAAETPVRPDDESAATPYMRELLRRSRENKAQYDRDRLEAYYKKNFKVSDLCHGMPLHLMHHHA
jgi:hypothetical protein